MAAARRGAWRRRATTTTSRSHRCRSSWVRNLARAPISCVRLPVFSVISPLCVRFLCSLCRLHRSARCERRADKVPNCVLSRSKVLWISVSLFSWYCVCVQLSCCCLVCVRVTPAIGWRYDNNARARAATVVFLLFHVPPV